MKPEHVQCEFCCRWLHPRSVQRHVATKHQGQSKSLVSPEKSPKGASKGSPDADTAGKKLRSGRILPVVVDHPTDARPDVESKKSSQHVARRNLRTKKDQPPNTPPATPVTKSSPKQTLVGIRLKNNRCYMISALLLLHRCDSFRNAIIELPDDILGYV